MSNVLGGMFERAGASVVSVNLLTDVEYESIKAVCPHDVEVSTETWAVFLSVMLQRPIAVGHVGPLVAEYNARLAKEYE